MAVYYRCDQARERRADAIFEETIAPLLTEQVEAGSLSGFGWLRHWMGGEWRRHEYVLGTDLNAMVDARTATIAALRGEHRAAIDEFDSICSSHDDYLWSVVSSSPPAAAAGHYPIGLATYLQCGSDEAEADTSSRTSAS